MNRCLTILFLILSSIPTIGQNIANCSTLTPKIDSTTYVINDCCVEIAPKYPGGDTALYRFLNRNLIISDSSNKMETHGKVLVYFIIDTTGEATDIRILEGLTNEINNKILKVLSIMPAWIPGRCANGKKVKMGLQLPINFIK